jgi:hypothetical protein
MRVKPAPFDLLCAWREVPILRQQTPMLSAQSACSTSQFTLGTPTVPVPLLLLVKKTFPLPRPTWPHLAFPLPCRITR